MNVFKYFYLIEIILSTVNHYLHTVKWFQVLLCNTNNSTLVNYLHTFTWIYICDLKANSV